MMHPTAWDGVSLRHTGAGVLCGTSWQEGYLWGSKASGRDSQDPMRKAESAPDKDSLSSSSDEISQDLERASGSALFGFPSDWFRHNGVASQVATHQDEASPDGERSSAKQDHQEKSIAFAPFPLE